MMRTALERAAMAVSGLRQRIAPGRQQGREALIHAMRTEGPQAKETQPPRFAQPDELHAHLQVLRGELGAKVVPSLLRAALSDLDRHLAVAASDAAEAEQRRAMHSFIGILDTFGCHTLSGQCRILHEQRREGQVDGQLQRQVLDQIALLRAEIAALLEQEAAASAAEPAGG